MKPETTGFNGVNCLASGNKILQVRQIDSDRSRRKVSDTVCKGDTTTRLEFSQFRLEILTGKNINIKILQRTIGTAKRAAIIRIQRDSKGNLSDEDYFPFPIDIDKETNVFEVNSV